jgi:hypothetical protein
MTAPHTPLMPMDVARYYLSRMARRIDADHFQELCRTVAYAIDPAQTAYQIALQHGLADLAAPTEIF